MERQKYTRKIKVESFEKPHMAICTIWMWSLDSKKQDEKRITAAEMWFYRRMLRISWKEKRTNESILKEIGSKARLLLEVNQRRLRYIGHATRHSKTSLMATTLQGKIEGKRKRGRPSVSYISNLKDMTGLGIHEIVTETGDRERWRTVVNSMAANIEKTDVCGDADR